MLFEGTVAAGDLLIACALNPETSALERRLGKEYSFFTTGLGVRSSRKNLQEHLNRNQYGLLLFSGTAGQLDPALEMGTVVCPRLWTFPGSRPVCCDPDLWNRLDERFQWELGLTVRRPVLTRKGRLRLFEDYGASVCDMESFGALELALQLGITCLSIKVVSDTAESGISGFWREFEANMDRLAEALRSLGL